MKKIYCIEKQWVEDLDIHNKFNNNCEFWNCIEEPWKVGCWDLQKNMMMKKDLKMIF